MVKLLNLIFILRDRQVLLGLKKRGFGKGKWNGFGGKVEVEETMLESVLRELEEESGLTAEIDGTCNSTHPVF